MSCSPAQICYSQQHVLHCSAHVPPSFAQKEPIATNVMAGYAAQCMCRLRCGLRSSHARGKDGCCHVSIERLGSPAAVLLLHSAALCHVAQPLLAHCGGVELNNPAQRHDLNSMRAFSSLPSVLY